VWAIRALFLLVALLVVRGSVRAQSLPLDNASGLDESSTSYTLADEPLAPLLNTPISSSALYVPPTEAQKFHDFTWNAFGPLAFAGSAFAAAIDQGFDFPREWGKGEGAYSARVASNFGNNLVTATAQYSLAEAFREDTAYHRCSCVGFFPRLWHAAISTVTARRGNDGDTSFSIALTASAFVGPMTAANTWIPAHNGLTLGFRMGTNNLLGQLGQNEAIEFLYGGPHTLWSRIQRRLLKKSVDFDSNS
jgi:hypothetical protein